MTNFKTSMAILKKEWKFNVSVHWSGMEKKSQNIILNLENRSSRVSTIQNLVNRDAEITNLKDINLLLKSFYEKKFRVTDTKSGSDFNALSSKS